MRPLRLPAPHPDSLTKLRLSVGKHTPPLPFVHILGYFSSLHAFHISATPLLPLSHRPSYRMLPLKSFVDNSLLKPVMIPASFSCVLWYFSSSLYHVFPTSTSHIFPFQRSFQPFFLSSVVPYVNYFLSSSWTDHSSQLFHSFLILVISPYPIFFPSTSFIFLSRRPLHPAFLILRHPVCCFFNFT